MSQRSKHCSSVMGILKHRVKAPDEIRHHPKGTKCRAESIHTEPLERSTSQTHVQAPKPQSGNRNPRGRLSGSSSTTTHGCKERTPPQLCPRFTSATAHGSMERITLQFTEGRQMTDQTSRICPPSFRNSRGSVSPERRRPENPCREWKQDPYP